MPTKFNWKPLIAQIKENEIVPVIGDDLSIVKLHKTEIKKNKELDKITIPNFTDGDFVKANLYDYLAVLLAKGFELKLGFKKVDLNDVVIEILKSPKGNLNKIYSLIHIFYNEISEEDIFLEPFEELAKISDFKTYITVNFDDFIEKAFTRVGREINPPINFSSTFRQIDPTKKRGKETSLFNLLGSILDKKDYALTDETFLEYIFFLKEKGDDETIFKDLFEAIDKKSFLLIGCSFPNWLMRFFIRVISNERFAGDIDSKRSKFVADNKTPKDRKLLSFLESYKVDVINISKAKFGNATVFVNELFRAWKSAGGDKCKQLKYKEKVFLSYNHKDRPFIKVIKDEFEKQGVKVFYDEKDLKPGDKYDSKIEEQILRGCDFFIPFISENSIVKDCYTYKYEWDSARTRRKFQERNKTTSFIKPYIIDDIDENDTRIPKIFRDLSIGKVKDEESVENMIASFIKDYELTRQEPLNNNG